MPSAIDLPCMPPDRPIAERLVVRVIQPDVLSAARRVGAPEFWAAVRRAQDRTGVR